MSQDWRLSWDLLFTNREKTVNKENQTPGVTFTNRKILRPFLFF